MKEIKIGVLGAGPFANHFIPLFKAHPLVTDVYLAERMKERRESTAEKFGLQTTFDEFDDLLESDAGAIGVFSQRWTHAPFAIKAMRAGKHVFSAVPAAVTLEDLEELIDTVKETGQLYMMGETTYYEGSSVLCRKQFRQGAFGRFVYAQSDYCHDMEHGFYPPYQIANGPEWKKFASFPPMLYPTHSVGQILSVTGGRLTRVACFGQVDSHEDGIFDKAVSFFDNDFSNESALFRSSEGGMCRANEFRRITGGDPLAVQGTKAAFIDGSWYKHDRTSVDLSDRLRTAPRALPDDWEEQKKQGAQEDFFCGVADIHDTERLPTEFHGLPNGHGGSHHFLADDFVRMLQREQTPVLNVWTAARFCAPGIVAHQSALRDGEPMEIPDFGNPPEGMTIMDVEKEQGKPALDL
jgi:predicted dehydrogenase